jgi:AAA domain
MFTTGGLGKSTLVNQVFTEMKSLTVFRDSKYLSFDLDANSNDDAVIGEVQTWLSSQNGPVLLVLDNAQRQRQLDCILNDTNIKDESFVLLTSSKRGLVAASNLYEMPTMKHNDALQLFRWHSQGASSSGVLKNRS